jgi:hypothetical protein
MKRTSMSPAHDSGCPGCQVKHTATGGSHRVTVPQTLVLPSRIVSTIGPPASRGNLTSSASPSPTECVASGHHSPKRAVKSSNARDCSSGTTTVLRSGASELATSDISSHPPLMPATTPVR